jgi:hypothetical protein
MRIDGDNSFNSFMGDSLPNPPALVPLLDNMINRANSPGFSNDEFIGQINSIIGLIRACNASSVSQSINICINQIGWSLSNTASNGTLPDLSSLEQALSSSNLTITPENYVGFLNQTINSLVDKCSNVSMLTTSELGRFAGVADFLDQIPEISDFDANVLNQWNTGFGIIAEDLRSIPSAPSSQVFNLQSVANRDINELCLHLYLLSWYTSG